MNATWKAWLTGLANAAVSGVASGGTASLVGIGWQKALSIAGVSAAVSAVKWLGQHPLPGTPNGVSQVIPIATATSNTNQENVGKINQ